MIYHDKRHVLSWNVTKYLHMSWNVTKYHYVMKCRSVPLRVLPSGCNVGYFTFNYFSNGWNIKCHAMSFNLTWHLMTCHDMPWCGQSNSERYFWCYFYSAFILCVQWSELFTVRVHLPSPLHAFFHVSQMSMIPHFEYKSMREMRKCISKAALTILFGRRGPPTW